MYKAINKVLDIFKQVHLDSTIVDFEVTHFGKPSSLFIGYDRENPPDNLEYPVIQLYKLSYGDASVSHNSLTLHFYFIGLLDEVVREGTVVETKGFLYVELWKELFISLLVKRFKCNNFDCVVSGESQDVLNYPLFCSSLDLVVNFVYYKEY
jgi:hypothetical protein